MQRRNPTATRRGRGALTRRLALGLSLALLAGAVALPASADTGPRSFTASVTPNGGGDATQVCASEPTEFALTLNNTSSQQAVGLQLGSANIDPGFPVREVADVETGRTSLVDGSTIELRQLRLAPGTSVGVTFIGTPPEAGVYLFGIEAKQANEFAGDGNDLQFLGAPVTVTVADCDPELSLSFATQPADAQVGATITGVPTGSPTVRVTDGRDDPVRDVEVTLSLEGQGSLVGTTSQPTTEDGYAIFDGLSIDLAGYGYVLTATVGERSEDSDPFDVFYGLATCDAGETCVSTADVPVDGGEFTISATGTALRDGARLTIGANDVPGESDVGCQPPTGANINTLPATVILDGQGLTDKRAVFTISEQLRKARTNNGVSFYQICAEPLGSIPDQTQSFLDRYTGNLVVGSTNPELATTSTQVRGFLPNCRSGRNAVPPPCVAGRSGSGDGGVAITMDFGSRFKTF